jgi:hypothetical protein
MATTPIQGDNNMTTTFTLKNLKVCEWASEETTCFTATLYVDGKRVGECSNDGQGGCNNYGFNETTYAELATEWLWEADVKFCEEIGYPKSDKASFKPDFDVLIANLMEQQDLVKQVKSFRNKVAKNNPTKKDDLVIYIAGEKIFATFAGSEHEAKIIAENSTAVVAPLEAKVTI